MIYDLIYDLLNVIFYQFETLAYLPAMVILVSHIETWRFDKSSSEWTHFCTFLYPYSWKYA